MPPPPTALTPDDIGSDTQSALAQQPAERSVPAAPTPLKDVKELRASPRYMVAWRIALVFDEGVEKLTYQGRTYDLSMNGTAMLTHHNVFSKGPVTILLAPPPLHKGGSKKVIEIHARQIYSVYSGALSSFRLGFDFVSFKGDGKKILKDMLSHYQPSAYRGDKSLK
ncbi:MAG: hypothetical protein WCV99_07780 [Sterolibacterium sp.]|jgi:hypothetical protein